MAEWYRNEDWSEAIAKDFERRLARSRSQKAQYLSLQAYHLLARHPDVARDLAQRAVDLNDEFETARALSFVALANLALENIDGALDAYESGLRYQMDHPGICAVQPVDYAFVVGIFGRTDRLPAALPIIEALPDEGVFGPDPQISAAKALVFALAGMEGQARYHAAQALRLMKEIPEVASLGIETGELRGRLAMLAGEDPSEG